MNRTTDLRRASCAALLPLLTGLVLGCRSSDADRVSPEEAVLLRQRQGLTELLEAARKGPLVPFDQVLVIVDQGLVKDLLESATPYERLVADRYRIRLESAGVTFEDGFALVRLDGRASLANRDEKDVFADVSVYGGLDVLGLDPDSGTLRAAVRVMAFEATRVGVLGMDAPVRRLIEDLGSERIEEFNVLASDLEIPVRLEREITIPEIGPEGEIRIPAAVVPLQVAVTDVKAYRGKLWVSIGVAVVPGAAAADTATVAAGDGR